MADDVTMPTLPQPPPPATPSSNELSPENILKAYEVHRSYITHEDGLVNQRTTWSLALQSFASAAAAFCFQKRIDIYEKALRPDSADVEALLAPFNLYEKILIATIFLGVTVSIFGSLSIFAATQATDNLATNWDKKFKEPNTFAKMLPDATGGGLASARRLGKVFAIVMPLCFLFIWLAFASLLILDSKSSLKFSTPPASSQDSTGNTLPAGSADDRLLNLLKSK